MQFFFVLLRIPGRIYELMPIAVLIGTLYALSSLARHSDYGDARIGDVGRSSVPALLTVALGFALLTFLVGEVVAPPAERATRSG